MNIFITGATGFVGKHLVNKLFASGHNLYCTLLANESNPFDKDQISNVFVLANDNVNGLTHFFQSNNIDGIIHLASYVQSANHIPDDIDKLADINIKFSLQVLEAASNAKVKWFINTGTYWQHFDNAEYSPVNLYAATKQAFMDLSKFYWETNRIFFCTIKLFDTYGPGDTRPKIFNLWERIAKSGETLDMSGGEQIIDISHVDSVVDAFAQLAIHVHNNNPKLNNGDVFALKAAKRYSLKQLAAKYETDHGVTLNINWGARPYREREVMMPWNGGRSIAELE